MTNEENYIRQNMGKHNPFKVPEGYFDSLGQRIMEQLPEREPVQMEPVRQPVLRVGRPWLYAAAFAGLLVVGIGAYVHRMQPSDEPLAQVGAQSSDSNADAYTDDDLDGLMFDNADIYAYLSE